MSIYVSTLNSSCMTVTAAAKITSPTPELLSNSVIKKW